LDDFSAQQVQALLNDDKIITLNELPTLPWSNSAPITGDFNHNGVVDTADYDEWRAHFGTDYTFITTIIDNVRLVSTGSGAGSSSAAPEPSSAFLALVAALVVGGSRRLRT